MTHQKTSMDNSYWDVLKLLYDCGSSPNSLENTITPHEIMKKTNLDWEKVQRIIGYWGNKGGIEFAYNDGLRSHYRITALGIDSLKIVFDAPQNAPKYEFNGVNFAGGFAENVQGNQIGGVINNSGNSIVGDGNQAVQGDRAQAVIGNNNNVTQTQQAAPSLTQAEAIALLEQLLAAIRESDLPDTDKEEAIAYATATKKAAEKPEPKKETALANLKGVAETLETASKAASSGKALWAIAQPILVKLAGWLGMAAGAIVGGL